MMILFLSILISLYNSVYSQTCKAWSTEIACVSSGAGACIWMSDGEFCRCASEVKLDIFFAVDTSGSIGWTDFQTEKAWLEGLVTKGIGSGAKLAFDMFSTNTNLSRSLQTWDDAELIAYVRSIRWTGGWTNTPVVIADALTDFSDNHDPERSKVLIIVTDGNPCLPANQGGCPQSVCSSAQNLKNADIRVIIIGVGSGWETKYVECLCQDPADVIPVASFTEDAFESILGSLSDVLCPITFEFKITEIKPEKNADCYMCDRFLEIWNSGIEFSADTILLSGVVQGTGTTTTVLQGQYLVFYDAETGYPEATDIGRVTCFLCDPSVCDLTTNSASAYTPCADTSDDSTETCHCENSVYIPCGSGSLNGYSCYFDDSATKTNWYQEITDGAGLVIDDVIYEANSWIETDDGYAYELLSKGFDNDDGDNWAQSCSKFGTPGSDPSATCVDTCSASGCRGASNYTGAVCNSAGQCECDAVTGYYPSCSGGACRSCKLVPEIEECDVFWRKNGTDKYAAYVWTDADGDINVTYKLSFFSRSQDGGILNAYTQGELLKRIDDYYRLNMSHGGYIQTVVQQCFDKYRTGDIICENYYSKETWCTVHTQDPTDSPSPAPTKDPTPSPTVPPTPAPTLPCPIVYFSNAEETICKPDRCNCCCVDEENCCLDFEQNPSKDNELDKYHKEQGSCWLDNQFKDGDRSDQNSVSDGDYERDGYLLTETTHFIDVKVEPEDYPCVMDVCWYMEFDRADCNWEEDDDNDDRRRRRRERRRLQDDSTDVECDADNPVPAGVGLEISPTEGCLVINGSGDATSAIVSFTVSRNDDDAYEDTAIFGHLRLWNATSRCGLGCGDIRQYPLDIPIWFNIESAAVFIPGEEEPLPAWLWWLVAAMVVFLALLAFLVYKYWWKNKATGAALASAQGDLDAAVAENEMGFGNNLGGGGAGFNPLATGFNPNAGGVAGNPNAPLNGDVGGKQFVNVLNQPQVFRQQFGPSAAVK